MRIFAGDTRTPVEQDFYEKLSSGQHRIVRPDTNFDINAFRSANDVPSSYMRQQHEDFVNRQLQTASSVQNYNHSSPIVTYNIGEIVLTERVDNADSLIQQLTDKVGGQYPIIKNTRI